MALEAQRKWLWRWTCLVGKVAEGGERVIAELLGTPLDTWRRRPVPLQACLQQSLGLSVWSVLTKSQSKSDKQRRAAWKFARMVARWMCNQSTNRGGSNVLNL